MNAIENAVKTQVRYLAERWRDSVEIPRIFDRDSRRANTEKIDVEVLDGRPFASEIRLDTQGFELFDFASPITDFTNDEAVTSIYRPAIAEFVKKQTHALDVFVTQHLIRTESKDDFNKAYARFLHCDYSMDTARSASLNLLKNRNLDPADFENAEFAWYNSWQPFDNPVEQNPLCMLDSTSLRDEDIVEYVYGGYGKSAKSSMPMYRKEHRFYYFKNMQPSEVVLIKQLDTRTGRAPVAPHTSFIDPAAKIDARPRRSIEVRMMAVFESGRSSRHI
ncbi:MAG: hypothetical protein F4W90_08070 [Gammaproteobacteria bacterium]|nr:hypothetical protein [Gammaproteobacteria bacterium]